MSLDIAAAWVLVLSCAISGFVADYTNVLSAPTGGSYVCTVLVALWSSVCHYVVGWLDAERTQCVFVPLRWWNMTLGHSVLVVAIAPFLGQHDDFVVGAGVCIMIGAMLVLAVADMVVINVKQVIYTRESPPRWHRLAWVGAVLVMWANFALLVHHKHADSEHHARVVLAACIGVLAGIYACLFGTWEPVEGRVLACAGAMMYLSAWTQIISVTDTVASRVVGVPLVGIHAVFLAVLLGAAVWRADVHNDVRGYDAFCTALYTACTLATQWLVCLNGDLGAAVQLDDARVWGPVLGSGVVGVVMWAVAA
jgi:hypothetical protein